MSSDTCSLEPYLPAYEKAKKQDKILPKYSCKKCYKYEFCPLISMARDLQKMKPNKNETYQTTLLGSKSQMKSYRERHKEWLAPYLDLIVKQDKCLNSKIHLHLYVDKYKGKMFVG